MALTCGIVGLPNVGKSTLFNCLTTAKALAANYPFATKDPNVGIISVSDPRLDRLNELVQPDSKVPTTVEIVDIAGLIKGASKGEGLGNQFLANIREVQAIVHVVRCFEDSNVVHVDGSVDPVRDKEIIDTELLLKDLDSVENRLEKLRKAAKSGQKEDLKDLATAENIYEQLEQGIPAREMSIEEEGQALYDELFLLTAKPVLYVCNVDEDSLHEGNKHAERFREAVRGEDAEVLTICAELEAQIAEFEEQEERDMFLEEAGLSEPGVHKLIRGCYELLDLITFFTAGPKEVRAWTVQKGATAPEAAGEIHSDFEKGFIRAEVISFEDYDALGSEQAVKEAGKMRMEGKDYLVQDGDVIFFRFNV